jgi:hypothetical protein
VWRDRAARNNEGARCARDGAVRSLPGAIHVPDSASIANVLPILVYPCLIKPTLVLSAVAPRLFERLNERLGLATLFRPAAEARGRV